MIHSTSFLAVALLALQATAANVTTPENGGDGQGKKSTRPNIVFIMTDDQDKLMDSTDYQPLLKKYIGEQGIEFHKHFCTVSLCCPSRVSLLTGKAAHNTNVTDVRSPYGGYPKFVAEGHNENYLPVWLQQAGYNTYYTGKLMNMHGVRTYNNPFPAGWNRSDYLLDPGTYRYLNSYMSLDEQEYRSMAGTYSTDNIRDRAVEFLGNGIDAGEPFFLGVAPIGPHGQGTPQGFDHPIPADRHKDLFPDLQVPRTANFNPDAAGDVHYLASAPKLAPHQVEYLDEYYRRRIQALQSVDELVEALMLKLEQHPDVLANTYLFYTSDNGYHLGQHRLPPGKCTSMEDDINVPLFVRGPGIARNASISIPTSHTDLTPTFFQIAGIDLRDDFDGVPMPLTVEQQQQQSKTVKGEHINVEYWGNAYLEGTVFPHDPATARNTYKALRVVADNYDFMYTVWCTNERMLYDMKQDPYQMNNLYGTSGNATGYPVDQLEARLDTLLLTLKNCKGEVCRQPWSFVFPPSSGQGIQTLADAMDPKYDEFFRSQEPVSFLDCVKGYLLEYEGSFAPQPFVNAKGEAVLEARMEDWV
ncbi:arylsulfatase precursor [Beauveria brongniartii RCEF 3172]|uniref:Arylsulfatase n=1 Tax=Beauveria brongniartii RCEF 3172 TaxID=1081107 RepID=A0A166Z4Y8_9HYPO|nr:arylsulfatase precursor [Beauveria brongniartii RCEF 3172]